jgi:putative SOS response-associated peptidase YedK
VDADESVRRLHQRMPLVIPPSHDQIWLSDDLYAESLLHSPCKSMLTSSEA